MTPLNTSNAKSSSYYAVFSDERLNNLKYYLQGVATPSISLQPLQIMNNRMTVNAIGTKLELSSLQMKVILDENLYNYLAVLDLLTDSYNQETGEIKQNLYNCDIFALSNKGNPILKFTYKYGYISSLSSIQYDDTVSDTQILTLDLEFVFTDMDYEKLSAYPNIIQPNNVLIQEHDNTTITTTKIN